MDTSIITSEVASAFELRTDSVTITMNLPEFALLYHLYAHSCGGLTPLRTGFAKGINDALYSLPVEDRQHVELANDCACTGGWNSELIYNYFKEQGRL